MRYLGEGYAPHLGVRWGGVAKGIHSTWGLVGGS